jgi:hypothetical protein
LPPEDDLAGMERHWIRRGQAIHSSFDREISNANYQDILIPPPGNIEDVDMLGIQWVLVVEKEVGMILETCVSF